MKSSLIKSALVLSAMAVGGVRTSLAADVSWVLPGPDSGSFTAGANWDMGVAPTDGDDAIIGNGGTALIGESDIITINNLRIDNGTVEQSGGLLTASGAGGAPTAFYIGATGGTGTYNVTGGTLIGGQVRIGDNAGTGSMTLSGTASYTGDGGRITRVANGAGSTGTLTITDDAQWTTNDWAIIGSGGTGTLNLSGESASMTVNGNFYVGDLGGNGTLNVSGTATIQAGQIQIATGGSTATATIQGGNVVSNGDLYVGNAAGSNGTLDIQGGSVSASGWVVIGRTGGTGTVTLANDATFTKSGGGNFSVGNGFNGASNGTLTIKDSATLDVQSGELWVGAEGGADTVGVMNVEGGTVETNNWVAIGRDHTNGTLNISGGVFNVNASGSFNGGPNFTTEGSETVNAVINQSGGEFNNLGSDTIIGETNGSVAVWNATGGTSNHNIIRLGGKGGSLGTMNISDAAVVNTNIIYVSSDGGSTGHLNVNGGTLTANRIEKGAGAGTVTFNGGTVKAGADEANFLADFAPGDLTIAAGGLKLDTNGHAVGVPGALGGEGGLTKVGGGTLTLSGLNTYEGATNVHAGALVVSGSLEGSVWLGLASGTSVELASNVSLNDTIILSLDGGSSINLNFSGEETIGSLVLNGTIIDIGTYNLAELQALGSTYNVTFSGLDATSSLVVTTAVPEPSTVALAIVGLGAALFLRRRASRQAVG